MGCWVPLHSSKSSDHGLLATCAGWTSFERTTISARKGAFSFAFTTLSMSVRATNEALESIDRTAKTAETLTKSSLGAGRAFTSVSNTVVDKIVPKEAVRLASKGCAHRLHCLIDDIVETAVTLPVSWRVIWLSGVVAILILGFTVLIVVTSVECSLLLSPHPSSVLIPGSFHTLVGLD